MRDLLTNDWSTGSRSKPTNYFDIEQLVTAIIIEVYDDFNLNERGRRGRREVEDDDEKKVLNEVIWVDRRYFMWERKIEMWHCIYAYKNYKITNYRCIQTWRVEISQFSMALIRFRQRQCLIVISCAIHAHPTARVQWSVKLVENIFILSCRSRRDHRIVELTTRGIRDTNEKDDESRAST